MRRLFIITLAVFAIAIASIDAPLTVTAAKHPVQTPTPVPTPIPPEDPAVTKIARQQFLAWQIGSINRKNYTDALNVLITQQQLDDTSSVLGQLGGFVTSEYFGPQEPLAGVPAGSVTYLYRMHCTNGSIYMQFAISPQGKVASLIYRNTLHEIKPTPSPSPTPQPTDTPAEPSY